MRKITASVLVLILVLGVLSACGKKSGGKETESVTVPSGAEPTESAEVTEIRDYVKSLAEGASYDGRSFTYYGGQDVNFPSKEEETGDIRSDALFYRQREITELFGLDWTNELAEGSDEVKDSLITEVMAGGDSYDLVHGFVRSVGRPTLNAGVLHEMQNLDHIDLEAKWWNQSLWDSYALDGKLYFLIGPINVYNYLDTHVILFNKNVTRMFSIDDDDIYNSVKEGKWTIDRMFEIAKAIPENSSGTGVYRYDAPQGLPFFFSAGYKITRFDEDGLPYVPDKLPIEYSNLADKIVPVFTDNSQSAFAYSKKNENFEKKYGCDEEDLFDDDRALFIFPDSSAVEYMRSFDVSFGIVPTPKLSENQKNYYCSTSSWSVGAVYVPKTVKNAEMTGRITEAMAALSQIHVKEAYYDKLLKSQGIFDLESADMLDIIFANKVYDMADLYSDGDINNLGPFVQVMVDSLTYDNENFASNYNAYSRVAKINIKLLLKTLSLG
ncbi:MAG: hypothetical protein IJS78_03160 [Clostridia bacterium]|nr:hypothetical protein [Clostridia bacterium]